MTDTLASRSSQPRIAELLTVKTMPGPSAYASPAPSPLFTSELPTCSEDPSPQTTGSAEIEPLPAPGTRSEIGSIAITDLPLAIPTPMGKPASKKTIFIEPVPLPEKKPTTEQPLFAPAIIETQTMETDPSDPFPASAPFVTSPSPLEGEKEKAPPSSPQHKKDLSEFKNIEESVNDPQFIEALIPIVETALEKSLCAPKANLHMNLEPMLRATVRRALAEQMQTIHHFGQINIIDRITWRLQALFTSRTYDDIVFERTHRYRVEEVYLLRHQSNSLISYASHDPSRHATPQKIKYDLSRLVEELKDENGALRKSFQLPNQNTAVVRSGQNSFLLASIRGPINPLVLTDLDYILGQVEQRFDERLRDQDQHFIHILQPLLEDCLLIQSPPPPH